MPRSDCRHFNGYKPCGKHDLCDSNCPQLSVPSARVLVVHLEALGAVMRSTALLPAVRRKFPGCHLTWVTKKPADQLLIGNPLVDRVLTTSQEDLLALSVLEFDVALVIDKGLTSAGVLKLTRADLVYGFRCDSVTGAVVPATQAASELWEIGLSNQKKFFENTKTELQLSHEALELGPYRRDEYVLELSVAEKAEATRRRGLWARPKQMIVGINTGSSPVIPYKKLGLESQRHLASTLIERGHRVVLLGGKEDTLRNERIAYGLDVVRSSTDRGLRDGMVSVAACDVVVTGDSLGMHLAIALKKWTVAWFGPTCAHEIDLFDRGVKVMAQVPCGPCWKRSCDRQAMCHDLVSIDELVRAIEIGCAIEPSRSVGQRRENTQPGDGTCRSELSLNHQRKSQGQEPRS